MSEGLSRAPHTIIDSDDHRRNRIRSTVSPTTRAPVLKPDTKGQVERV